MTVTRVRRGNRVGRLALAASLLVFVCFPASAEVPARTFEGQTLEVPEQVLDQGFAYHTQPGEDTQLVVRSRAELQNLVFLHSRVVGYLVVPFDLEEGGTPVLGGAFRIPSGGFRTSTDAGFFSPACQEFVGCQAADLFAGPDYLDSSHFPEITFEVARVDGVELVSSSAEKQEYRLNLSGPLMIRGQSRTVVLESELSLLPSSRRTMIVRNVGDMATLRTRFELKTADFGWTITPAVAGRVPEALQVDIFLMLNTVSPDKSLDPRDDPRAYRNYLHYFTLLRDLRDLPAARSFAQEYLREIWQDQKELNRLAGSLVNLPGVSGQELRFARKAAERANQLSGFENVRILEILARIHFELGDLQSAVEWQKKLVDLSEEGSAAEARAKSILNRYQEGLPVSPE